MVRARPGWRLLLRPDILILLGTVAGVGLVFWGNRLPQDVHAVLLVLLVLGLTGAFLFGELLGPSRTRDD